MLAEAFRSGCSGYALKENAFDELATAIRKVSDGDIYVSTVAEAEKLGFRRAYRWKGSSS